ncbi:MAG: hypothetical protein IJX77_02335 [Ruminococcus sp.]|nr:hypothetical protein [Ruminococcus sp.]
MTKEQLEKINQFTRRELSADEVYAFSVILCDNDIDRDGERFSDEALGELQKLFIGKTGIFDHNASSSNQNARIYDTELVTDDSRTTKNGEVYKYLKASVYMVRTDENRSLIAEIDGGIKKEVSISCTASKRICSVCGCDRNKTSCAHVKGKSYNGKLCHTILGGITDAYEWSFVAVPAQVNAGVTKKLSSEGNVTAEAALADIKAADEELRRDIRRLAFFSGGKAASDAAALSAESMNTAQLIALKKSFESKNAVSFPGIEVQLAPESAEESFGDEFSMK